MGDWQPIETAPHDGTRILGWDGVEMNTLDWQKPTRMGMRDHIKVDGYWYQVSDSGRSSAFYPTHWMPLPEPPKEGT